MSANSNITIPIAKAGKPEPAVNVWWWNPNRYGIDHGPDWFTKQLHDIDPELEVTWSPLHERWLVWAKSPKLTHPVCQGWRLLFVHHDRDHNHLPLSEMVFARIFEASVFAQGSAKRYFDRIIDEQERDDARRDTRLNHEAIDRAMPQFDYSKIKVSGCGPSNGSKFSTFFA